MKKELLNEKEKHELKVFWFYSASAQQVWFAYNNKSEVILSSAPYTHIPSLYTNEKIERAINSKVIREVGMIGVFDFTWIPKEHEILITESELQILKDMYDDLSYYNNIIKEYTKEYAGEYGSQPSPLYYKSKYKKIIEDFDERMSKVKSEEE